MDGRKPLLSLETLATRRMYAAYSGIFWGDFFVGAFFFVPGALVYSTSAYFAP